MFKGWSTVLSKVENIMEKCLMDRSKMDYYPCDQVELKELIKEYIENNKLASLLKNNKSG